jgi:hypothetical protein
VSRFAADQGQDSEQRVHITPDGRTITKLGNSNIDESGPIPWKFAPQERRDTSLT